MLHRLELFLLALLIAVAATSPAYAGSGSLPPDVDLDPDRGMTFGRLPKTSFDRRVFDPMKRSLASQAMDPSIDPYNPVVRSSRYEPGTGKIRDSLTDKVRDLRRNEETARKNRAALARRESDSSLRKLRQPGARNSSRPAGSKTPDD